MMNSYQLAHQMSDILYVHIIQISCHAWIKLKL
jgi:hypothetical protein